MTSTFKKPKGHPVDYYVPDFGLDFDIQDSLDNTKELEHKYGKWQPSQDDNGVWMVPGAADNDSYSYRV